jgi:hypothetical protein
LELTILESFVLKHPLDGSILAGRREFCLEDNAEGAIANDFALGVLQVPCLACDAVLDLLANYLCSK